MMLRMSGLTRSIQTNLPRAIEKPVAEGAVRAAEKAAPRAVSPAAHAVGVYKAAAGIPATVVGLVLWPFTGSRAPLDSGVSLLKSGLKGMGVRF